MNKLLLNANTFNINNFNNILLIYFQACKRHQVPYVKPLMSIWVILYFKCQLFFNYNKFQPATCKLCAFLDISLDVRLRMASWLWLGSAFGVVAFVCLLVFPLPPLPIRGGRGFSPIVSPLNVLFSVTGA